MWLTTCHFGEDVFTPAKTGHAGYLRLAMKIMQRYLRRIYEKLKVTMKMLDFSKQKKIFDIVSSEGSRCHV